MGSIAANERVGASDIDELVRRAALGDAMAFDSLIATRLDRCYRLAYTILGNEADAADATQEAVVSAWRQLPRLRDQRSFDSWLNRIVAKPPGCLAGIGCVFARSAWSPPRQVRAPPALTISIRQRDARSRRSRPPMRSAVRSTAYGNGIA